MACRFTWLSGLLFDEYRKRQTAEGFTWGDKGAPPVYSRPSSPASAAAAAAQRSASLRRKSASHRPGSQRTMWVGEGRGVTVHDNSVLKEGICACSGTEAFFPTGPGAAWNIMPHLWERASRQRILGLSDDKPTALSN